jgi:dUTP pyrophosphatase
MSSAETIAVIRLDHGNDLPVPHRLTEGSSGCDIAAAVETAVVIEPGDHALIPTGFCFAIPPGYEIQVRSRSGLAYKYGVMVLNSPGTIDSDYRGEVKIILANFGPASYTVNRGDRIAQLVPMRIPTEIHFKEVVELSETTRGEGGFGHSGV